ncbi:hypothetical protein ACLOJK_033698 [Asimina triloba]
MKGSCAAASLVPFSHHSAAASLPSPTVSQSQRHQLVVAAALSLSLPGFPTVPVLDSIITITASSISVLRPSSIAPSGVLLLENEGMQYA